MLVIIFKNLIFGTVAAEVFFVRSTYIFTGRYYSNLDLEIERDFMDEMLHL